MKRVRSYIGQKINSFTIIDIVPKYYHRHNRYWSGLLVRCDCGYEKYIVPGDVRRLRKCNDCLIKDGVYRKFNHPGDRFCETELLEINSKNGYTWYKIKCDCGTIYDSRHFGKKKRCNKCQSYYIGRKHSCYKGTDLIPHEFFQAIINSANKRNILVSIDIEYITKLLKKQNFICALSGLPLTLYTSGEKTKFNTETTASLDRIDSSKGYIEGNVQWLHKDVNKMKWDFNTKEFIKYCYLISKNTIEI